MHWVRWRLRLSIHGSCFTCGGRVDFICGCLRCLSRRQMSPAPQTCAASKRISGHRASTWKRTTRVMSHRWLKTMQFATKRQTFLKVYELFVFLILQQKTAFLVTFHWKEQIKTTTQNLGSAVAIASSVSAEAKILADPEYKPHILLATQNLFEHSTLSVCVNRPLTRDKTTSKFLSKFQVEPYLHPVGWSVCGVCVSKLG